MTVVSAHCAFFKWQIPITFLIFSLFHLRQKKYPFLSEKNGIGIIFCYSRPERAKFRLAPRPESLLFRAAVQKNLICKKKLVFCIKNVLFYWIQFSMIGVKKYIKICVRCWIKNFLSPMKIQWRMEKFENQGGWKIDNKHHPKNFSYNFLLKQVKFNYFSFLFLNILPFIHDL